MDCDGCFRAVDWTSKLTLRSCSHFFCAVCSAENVECNMCKMRSNGNRETLNSSPINVPWDMTDEASGLSPTFMSEETRDLISGYMASDFQLSPLKGPFDVVDPLKRTGWTEEDEESISRLDDLMMIKKNRFERIIEYLDELKQEYVQRLCNLPMEETDMCRKRVSEIKSIGIYLTPHRLEQVSDEVFAIRRQISEISQSQEMKAERSIDGSVLSIKIVTPNTSKQATCTFKFEPWNEEFPAKLGLIGSFVEELYGEMIPNEVLEEKDFDIKTLKIEDLDEPYFYQVEASATPGQTQTVRVPTESTGAIPKTPPVNPNVSWSHMARQNCPPKLPRPERTVAETNTPHCYFDIQIRQLPPKRVVIQVRTDKAPFMGDNFIQLCLGSKGYGYKGSKIFRAMPNNHVLGGDFEKNNGSGGYSAFDTSKLFMAEQCPLRDEKGAVRMRGLERTSDGRCKVGSQFMVWVGDLAYKTYKHTLVFGKVTEGLAHLQEISRIGSLMASKDVWLLREEVTILRCGVL